MPVSPSTCCQVALLTAPGRAAIAVVGLRGGEAARLIEPRFRPVAALPAAKLAIGRIYFGHWQAQPDLPAEELVVTRQAEDQFEIHCHGGVAAAGAIMAGLVAGGAEPIDGERWMTSVQGDPLQQSAAQLLPSAATERMAAILLDQQRGALRRAIEETLADLERGETAAAGRQLAALLAHAPITRHFPQPWRVVLAGRPNVGKSSLINALVGYRRAIVHATPGTTRDVVTAVTAIDGWPVELADTAGLRDTPDAIEREGVARAQQVLATADLILHVRDAAQPAETSALPTETAAAQLTLWNKSDLLPATAAPPAAGLAVSAVTGRGLPELLTAIAARLVPHPPAPGAAVPVTEAQRVALATAQAHLLDTQPTEAAAQLRALLMHAGGAQRATR